MSSKLGYNIHRYRKELGLTQSQLAKRIGVTFQAISKWETGQTVPEVSNVTALTQVLGISVDVLLGHNLVYAPQQQEYDALYNHEGFYWGLQPTVLSLKVLQHKPPRNMVRLLDAGCREGQNAVFFARNGYQVTGVDISKIGIEKARKLAQNVGVQPTLLCASMVDFMPTEQYDVFFCDEILHLLKHEHRKECINRFKEHTAQQGIHVVCVPVHKPYVPQPQGSKVYPWYSGELMQMYADWHILETQETDNIYLNGNVYSCVYNIVVAQKPSKA